MTYTLKNWFHNYITTADILKAVILTIMIDKRTNVSMACPVTSYIRKN